MAISDVLTGSLNLARGLIRPTKALDVVAITAVAGFVPLFSAARPLGASVYEVADLMEHPLETGATIADHIVFQPVEIDLPLICVGEVAYRSTYALIRATFTLGTLLTVRTRTGNYPNMVIIDMPHEETADMFDGIVIRLRLREAKFVTPKTGLAPAQTKNGAQASTVKRGAQQTSAAGSSAASKASASAAASGAGATPKGSTLYQWAYGA